MRVAGKDYKTGDPIPTSQLPPGRLKQLVDLRRVAHDSVVVRPKKEG
jgi:hypothetical protein